MAKEKLDPQTIAKKGPGTYWDTLTPGLHLRVSPRGKRTFALRYRSPEGKHRRQSLGTFDPERFTLAKARRMARDARAELEEGKDPFAPEEPSETPDTSSGQTFGDMAEAVLARKKRDTRAKTQKDRRRMLDKVILAKTDWAPRGPQDVKRADVVALHQQVGKDSPVLANRVLALIHLIFNEGLRLGWGGLEYNPATMVERFTERERNRTLERDEMKTLWTALDDEHLYIAGAIRLALLTAQRIGSIRQMRWDQIKGSTWRIPEEVFKGKREHWLPLSSEAQEILDTFRDNGSEWVFPAARGGEGHVEKTDATIRRVWQKKKLERFTAHDFRTTFNTWSTRAATSPDPDIPAGLGVEPDVSDAVLGHKDTRLSLARYHGRPEEHLLAQKREALARWGRFVMDAVEK